MVISVKIPVSHSPIKGGGWVEKNFQARRQASAWTCNGSHSAIEQPHERRRCAVRIKIKTINLYVYKQYIEDSVGNNVSLYIVAGGLPAYTSDEVKNIYENSESGRKKDVADVEWMTVNGSGFNVEGLNWLVNVVFDRIDKQLNLIIEKEDIYNKTKYNRFMLCWKNYLSLSNKETINFLKTFNYSLTITGKSSGTRSEGEIQNLDQLAALLPINNDIIYQYKDGMFRKLDKKLFGDDPLDDGIDSDECPNYLENIYGTSNKHIDTDNDMVPDNREFRVILRTNLPIGIYTGLNSNHFIAIPFKQKGPFYYGQNLLSYYYKETKIFDNTYDNFNNIIYGDDKSFIDVKYISSTVDMNPIYYYKDTSSKYYNIFILTIQDDKINLFCFILNPNMGSPEVISQYPSIGNKYKEIVIRYTDPTWVDTDNDGLMDYFELFEYLTFNERGIELYGSIPRSEWPDPIVPDVYIEVDWMEDSFKTKKSFWDKYFGWLTGSTGTIFRINHEFDRVARNRIIGVFDQAPIEVNLHIDDGRDHWNGIGEGGDEVRYNESIHAYEYNDFKNINWYREGVFRYALMVDKVYDDDRKQSVRGITSTGKRLIYVSSPLDEANEVAHVFLHELGHLLALNADYLFKPEKASLARKYVKEKKPEKYLDYAIGPDEGYYSCMSYNPKADGILDYSNTGLKTDRIGVYRCDPFYIGDENEMNDLEKNGMFYEDTNAYSKNRPGLLINDWQNMVFGYGVMRFGHYWGV